LPRGETRARNSLREIFFGRRNLLERIGGASNYEKLSDFVIAHYSHEWAMVLIDLLAHQYFRFHEWLLREGRFLPAKRQSRERAGEAADAKRSREA